MDELLEDISEVFFKFNDDEPIMFAHTIGDFSLTLLKDADGEYPSVEFNDGSGNKFSIFIKTNNGI